MTSRELALAVVRDVFPRAVGERARGAHEAFAYHAERSGLSERDRAFSAELAYGSIKARRYLDWLLAPYIGERAPQLPPTILEILRLGAYQLARMAVAGHAAVSETVGLAKRHGHRGTAGLVNAVLRRIAALDERDRTPQRERFLSDDDYLGTLHSFPTWIVASVRKTFGDEVVEPVLRGMNAPPQTALRVNLLRLSPEQAIDALRAAGVTARHSDLVAEIVLVTDGAPRAVLDDPELRWEQQGEIAAIPVDLLAPQPGAHGVELCSGRGNKTLEIVGRMHDRGLLETIERDPRKVAQERERLERLGAYSVVLREGDATAVGEGEGDATDDADFVLVDAPCSGLGILGRQPEARWRKEPGDPVRLAPLQAALLDAAAKRVHDGGRLVYSVCSFDARETHERVEAFLEGHHEFARGATPLRYERWRLPSGDLRVPPGIDGRDGFFIAVLERRALR